jgi:site-specific recombinase XerD
MQNAPSDQINAFLTHLAVNEKPSASSQDQALGALLLLFSNLQGTPALVAQILYGSGLRLMEALCLRIKDVELEKNSIVVRDRKGDKDRITMLPESLKASLKSHLSSVYELHQKDLSDTTTSMPARYRKRCVQPLGHSDAKTKMIYTHVLNRGVVDVKSPADLLFS